MCRLLIYDRRQSGGDSRSGLPDHDTKDITGLALRANLFANSTCTICHNLITTSARNRTTIFPFSFPLICQPSATSWRISSDKTSNRFCHSPKMVGLYITAHSACRLSGHHTRRRSPVGVLGSLGSMKTVQQASLQQRYRW